MSFNDKVVLVTGASSGIGAAIAVAFAAQGANVAMVGRNEEKLTKISEKCQQYGKKPLVLIADMTNDEDVKRIISGTIAQFGKLDVLVNNAGIGTGMSILAENTMQIFDKVVATNLRAPAYLTNLAVPHLIESKGNIINISSVAGMIVLTPRSSAYCASKAGLDHFTKCVALELAPKGVRVNSINPGPVQTDIIENMGAPSEAYKEKMRDMFKNATATGRMSDPEEIADLALFLASDKARSITGSSYVIDNGSMLKGPWLKE